MTKDPKDILDETEEFRGDIVDAVYALRRIGTEVRTWDWHNQLSYELVVKLIQTAHEAIEQLAAHTSMVATNSPTHDRYKVDCPPNHIKIQRTKPDEWEMN